ncbi:ribonuclease Trv [Pyronema omphalodes]|nr:ribonuclease Trv [Pyronema omphalodes]
MQFLTLLTLASALVAPAFAQFREFPKRQTSCPDVLSCHAPSTTDTCCVESPGGLVLLTQFWDYSPPAGPVDSWTIHGLWPDNCDGTFESSCDPARAYPSITDILQSRGETELLDEMSLLWKGLNGDEDLWQHEWAKHGTCMSTLEPTCYGASYENGMEVVDFSRQTVDLHKKLDSFKFLEACGITPSTTKTYSKQEIVDCLTTAHGAVPYIGCSGSNINEIWYFHWVRGKIYGGVYEPTDSTASSTKCPATGIIYTPK